MRRPRLRRPALECTTCGKLCFPSERAAKKAARSWFPKQALCAYRCGAWWHIGHTAPVRVRGERREK